MKDLVSNLLSKLHLIIFAYAAWTAYEVYSTHEDQLAEIVVQKNPIVEEIKKAEEKLGQIDEFRKNVDQTKIRVTEVFNSIEKVQKQLPSEINDIEVLDFFSKEAKALNLLELEPTPLEESPQGFYILKPYKLKARGTFLQFLILLERINSAERLFNVRQLVIVAPTELQKGRFHVVNMEATIDTFKYNAQHKESSGVDEIETQFKEDAKQSRPRKKRKKEAADE